MLSFVISLLFGMVLFRYLGCVVGVFGTLTCNDNQNYIRIVKQCGAQADEESYVIRAGQNPLVVSQTFADDEYRESEFCIPKNTMNRYMFTIVDSYGWR